MQKSGKIKSILTYAVLSVVFASCFIACSGNSGSDSVLSLSNLAGKWLLYVNGYTAPNGPAPAGTALSAAATFTFNDDGSCSSTDQIVLGGNFIPSRSAFRSTDNGGSCSYGINADGKTGQFDVLFPEIPELGIPAATTQVTFVQDSDTQLKFIASNSGVGIFGAGEMRHFTSAQNSIAGTWALFVQGSTSAGGPAPAGTPLAAIATVTFADDGTCSSTDQLVVGGAFVPARDGFRSTDNGGSCNYSLNDDGTGQFSVTFPALGNIPEAPTEVTFVRDSNNTLNFIAANSGVGIFGGGEMRRLIPGSASVSGTWSLSIDGFTSPGGPAPAGTPLFALANVTFNDDGTCQSKDQIVLGGTSIPGSDIFRSTTDAGGSCVYSLNDNGTGQFSVTFPGIEALGIPTSATEATFVRTNGETLFIIASNPSVGIFGSGEMNMYEPSGSLLDGTWSLFVEGFRSADRTPLAAVATFTFNADGSCSSSDQLVLGGNFVPGRNDMRFSSACNYSEGNDGFGKFSVTFPGIAELGIPAAATDVTFYRESDNKLKLIANNTGVGIFGGGEMQR